MIGVSEARARAAAAVTRHLREWASDPREARDARLRIALHPPTEREVLAQLTEVRTWRDEWDAIGESATGCRIDWSRRTWPSVGTQNVPTHLELIGADAIAEFARDSTWQIARERAAAIVRRLGQTNATRAAIRTHIARLAEYDADRFTIVLDVASWIVENPTTGFRPRQVPVRGVDSKWIGTHRTVLTALVSAVTGTDGLGLVDSDPLIRIRILDPRLHPAGPHDLAASPAQLARLDLAPATVLVFENLESTLALPPLAGVVAVHGSGFAVGAISEVPWARRARVIYWGDLDSNGFAILHRLRSHLPETQTVLMDERTLSEHSDLWVAEPTPARGSYPTLNASEEATLAAIRAAGDVRLEQERIPWEYAMAAITRSL